MLSLRGASHFVSPKFEITVFAPGTAGSAATTTTHQLNWV